MSKEIIDAAASYFGMDPAHLAQGTMAAGANGLRFTFTVEVNADDYMGIADRMRAMRGPAEQSEDADLLQYTMLPSLQEVMRDPVPYMDRPECGDLLAKAGKLSKAVNEKIYAEAQRRAQAARDDRDAMIAKAEQEGREAAAQNFPGEVPKK